MSTQTLHGPTKRVWSNKFQCPGPRQLREGYEPELRAVFDAARELILEREGLVETVVWHGVPWRWTLVYQDPAGENGYGLALARPTRAFAYLIADPARLQVCLPLTREQIAAMPLKRFKKVSRDSIIFARAVAGVAWPNWDLPTQAAVEDVAEVVRRKHKMTAGVLAGAVAVEA
jgi:hypothetical protein